MVTTFILVFAAVVVALLVYAATKPDTMQVQRSTIVDAPADTIFPLIADFYNWGAWSPFDKLDPAMKRTYSGAASGKGAVYEWAGNSKVGQGRMEITDLSRPSRVAINLDFVKPFP